MAIVLQDMIADYYIEAARWPVTARDEIRISAGAIVGIRDRLILGTISIEDAAVWAEQGRAYLDDITRNRSQRNHPSGKAK